MRGGRRTTWEPPGRAQCFPTQTIDPPTDYGPADRPAHDHVLEDRDEHPSAGSECTK